MSCETSMLFILENFIENSFIYVFGFLTGAFSMMVYADTRRRASFWQLMDTLPNLMDVDFQFPSLDQVVEFLRTQGLVFNVSSQPTAAWTTTTATPNNSTSDVEQKNDQEHVVPESQMDAPLNEDYIPE